MASNQFAFAKMLLEIWALFGSIHLLVNRSCLFAPTENFAAPLQALPNRLCLSYRIHFFVARPVLRGDAYESFR